MEWSTLVCLNTFFHKVELFFDGVECSKQAFSVHYTKSIICDILKNCHLLDGGVDGKDITPRIHSEAELER